MSRTIKDRESFEEGMNFALGAIENKADDIFLAVGIENNWITKRLIEALVDEIREQVSDTFSEATFDGCENHRAWIVFEEQPKEAENA